MTRKSGSAQRRAKRDEWLQQQPQQCNNCGEVTTLLDIDHRIPRWVLGETRRTIEVFNLHKEARNEALANCQLLCKPCHRAKSGLENAIRLALIRIAKEKN